jgi:uncharacterized coiled-coil protein SlyX
MSFLKKVRLPLAVIAVIAIIVNINARMNSSASEIKTETQDMGSLDRRISMLEQRFFILESGINRLQQVVVAQRSTQVPSARDPEVALMRQEIEGLKLRLNEIECGLVKLDERTTPAGANTRKRDEDPCRLNPTSPVRLSTRP